jgi:hypothetical protein
VNSSEIFKYFLVLRQQAARVKIEPAINPLESAQTHAKNQPISPLPEASQSAISENQPISDQQRPANQPPPGSQPISDQRKPANQPPPGSQPISD